MCGILCNISYSSSTCVKDDKLIKRVKNRGPDCWKTSALSVNQEINAIFCGAVLWMQGLQLAPQPVRNDRGVLLYNGDIFDETWNCDVSDTIVIMEKISTYNISKDEIIEQIKSLKGPFAIIYYDVQTNDLYFTRDRIGRTSLLLQNNDDSVIISNVLGRDYDCVEIPATHIQILNLVTKQIQLHPYNDELDPEDLSLDIWVDRLRLTQSLPDDEFQFHYLQEEFSQEDGVVEYIQSISQNTKCKTTLFENLMGNDIIKETVLNLTELLEKSVKLRLIRQPNKCKECINTEITCDHCTIGILFSGGLDCTILALLADKYVSKAQSIDLINVAFRKDDNMSYDVPDRLTGKQSLQELKKLCPQRTWAFKEINVSKDELEKYQETIIGDLVYPRQTVLDESLGTALWFASRGQDSTSTSTSRVLLLGSGADELFGGYVRHRNAFKRNGWQGLHKELLLDWSRISFRNLSRDNRVICDHGRQPRMPYLDEDFSNYVLHLKPWLRCFPSNDLGVGVGDKLMLRLIAFNLGLTDAVVLPKRALQFGSRIANKKEKGSNVSKTFLKILNQS